MNPLAARTVCFIALASPVSCSLFQHSTTAASQNGVGGVHNYTDSDVISGVAVAREAVYVGTARGVLRYPTAGGTPTRMTTEQGLPDNQIYAVSASADGTVWAATPHGVARMGVDHWQAAGDAQPDVGRITAVLALEGGGALLGGSTGIARFDGARWTMLTNQYQVTAFAMDQGRPMVATAQSGILALRGDFTSLDEYGNASGIPEALVRSFVPVGEGKMWALVQGTSGAKLAYYDGHHWLGYSSEHQRTPWLAVVPYNGGAALVVQGGLFEILPGRGDGLAPTEASNPDGQRRVTLTPTEVVPTVPTPPVAPPVAPVAPAPHGRGHRPAGRGRHDRVETGETAGRSAQTHRGAPVTEASAAPPGHAATSTATNTAASTAPAARPPAIRPRNIPAYAEPVEVVRNGPTISAPSFGLMRATVSMPDDVAAAWGGNAGLFVWRIGLGVSRLAGGPAVDFRTHDLAMQHRPLSLATDANNNVWFVTEDGGPARYDGTRFQRVQIDNDPNAVPLMFWSRGTTAAAVARVGSNVLRTYRFAGRGWQMVTERPVDTGGPGTIDVKFLSVDGHGRYWLGIRVTHEGHVREHGVAVLDESPAATQFNSRTPPTGAPQGAVPAPDDLTAVDFDGQGTAWFAGLSGATSIALADTPGGAATVHTYNETSGLRGDLVSDLVRGPANRIYIATPEGLGYHDGTHFVFDVVGSSSATRVIGLAADVNGAIWGAGPRGAWIYNGQTFRTVGRRDGLPSEEFNDLAVDGENRVWFVTSEGISVLVQPNTPAPVTMPGSTPSSGDETSS